MELMLGDAIREFLKKSRLKSGVQSVQLEQVWADVMGKTIANYTDKVQIINGTLFITTHVAPLKTELIYQREKIIQRVNEAMGENVVKEVVVR